MAAVGFVVLATSARHYPFDPRFGFWWGGLIFLIIFSLTYLREERRAARSPDSNLVINWNLAEALLLFLSAVLFLMVSFILNLSDMDIYAYFNTGLLGLLTGVIMGEFLWQNSRLKELDESCQERYWANYKDSIF